MGHAAPLGVLPRAPSPHPLAQWLLRQPFGKEAQTQSPFWGFPGTTCPVMGLRSPRVAVRLACSLPATWVYGAHKTKRTLQFSFVYYKL